MCTCSGVCRVQGVKLADRAVAQRRITSDRPSRPRDQDLHRQVPTEDSTSPEPSFMDIKQDLVEAQRARFELEANATELKKDVERLRTASGMDRKALGELAAEKSALLMKLRDRDEELKGKAKLLEVSSQVQGEGVQRPDRMFKESTRRNGRPYTATEHD